GAHLADLIRLELLINYGGIWTDATVFYSGDLPDFLFKNRLFAYQIVKPGRDGQAIPMSNWLLVAPKRNRLLLITRDLLYAYWRRHDKLLDYYIFHIFFQLAAEACPKDFAKVIPVDSGAPHLLGLRLFDQYEPDFWQAIKDQTSIHKLSYKFPPGMFLQKGTYYAQVVKGGKNG
ncbi:capsular polysaccharide synthesis protein, partial [Lactobacillus sp.]|uniref:capsular polysaccharide synthesis protein n=1 Tax=Lactobacillus sp. TaxID=1591 RepID=UPI003F01BADE